MIKYHLNTADMEMVTLSHYADDDFERVSINIGMGPKARLIDATLLYQKHQ